MPRRLTLISAPAGFGKTTLASSWLEQVDMPAAWLSLDEDDNDLARFLAYFIAALQTIRPEIGTGVLAMLQSAPLPHSHTLLTPLINDLTEIPEKFVLVLDDYHTIENETIAEVAALDRRTEGWIAGLQMAALSLQQRDATAIAQFNPAPN